MESVPELRKALEGILAVDRAQRKALADMLRLNPAALKNTVEAQTAQITRTNAELLGSALQTLAKHDSSDAVDAIGQVLGSDQVSYRVMALHALASMSSEQARQTIARRLSFWSGAGPEERAVARRLLGRSESSAAKGVLSILGNRVVANVLQFALFTVLAVFIASLEEDNPMPLPLRVLVGFGPLTGAGALAGAHRFARGAGTPLGILGGCAWGLLGPLGMIIAWWWMNSSKKNPTSPAPG